MHRATRFVLAALGVLTTTAALAQTPAPTPAQTPAAPPAQEPAAAPAPEAAAEDTGSLFAPRWNEVTFGGRWTSVSGDEARFQRYQDQRSGAVVDGFRFAQRHRSLDRELRRRQHRLSRSAVRRHLRAYRVSRRSPASGTRSRSSTASTRARRTRRSAARQSASTTRPSVRFRTARPPRKPTSRWPRSSTCASGATSAHSPRA